MAIGTLSFAKTLEGIMRTIKTIIETFREAWSIESGRMESLSEDYLDLANKYSDLSKEHEGLWRSYCESQEEIGAQRAQKERYRTAFLSRMNVPVIGKAWTGDDYSEES
jgi:hypothetical protein